MTLEFIFGAVVRILIKREVTAFSGSASLVGAGLLARVLLVFSDEALTFIADKDWIRVFLKSNAGDFPDMVETPRADDGQARRTGLFHPPDSPASRPHSRSDKWMGGPASVVDDLPTGGRNG